MPIPAPVEAGPAAPVTRSVNDVADEPSSAVGVDHLTAGRRRHRVRQQDGLDLGRFDADAAHLDLAVAAADVLQVAGRPGLAAGVQVAGAVHPPTGRSPNGSATNRVGGQVRAALVAAAHHVPATYSSPVTPTGFGTRPGPRT